MERLCSVAEICGLNESFDVGLKPNGHFRDQNFKHLTILQNIQDSCCFRSSKDFVVEK